MLTLSASKVSESFKVSSYNHDVVRLGPYHRCFPGSISCVNTWHGNDRSFSTCDFMFSISVGLLILRSKVRAPLKAKSPLYKQGFNALSLSLSSAHRPDMTEILLKGCTIASHVSIRAPNGEISTD